MERLKPRNQLARCRGTLSDLKLASRYRRFYSFVFENYYLWLLIFRQARQSLIQMWQHGGVCCQTFGSTLIALTFVIIHWRGFERVHNLLHSR